MTLLVLASCKGSDPVPLASSPLEPLLFAGYAWYAGDVHAHTGVSGDAESWSPHGCADCGRFDQVFAAARGEGLSWLAIPDHVNGYPAATAQDFDALWDAVLGADGDGLVTVPAAEVWFRGPSGALGHKTLLMFGDDLAAVELADLQPAPGGGEDVTSCDAVWAWASGLSARIGPVALVPHHPAGNHPMPTDWTCASAEWQPAVEVYSEHGSSFAAGDDRPRAGITAAGTIEAALDPAGAALRMGFVAGTDSHDTRPGDTCVRDFVRTNQPYGGGITVVRTDEDLGFDRAAVGDALRERRTVATTGPVVAFDLAWVSGGVTLGGLGDDVTLNGDLEATVTFPDVTGTAVTRVELVGPDRRRAMEGQGTTWTLTTPAEEVPAYLYVAVELDGDALYPDGCDDGGLESVEWAWGSPSWFEVG